MFRYVCTVPDIWAWLGPAWPSFRPKPGSKSKISGRILKKIGGPFSSAESLPMQGRGTMQSKSSSTVPQFEQNSWQRVLALSARSIMAGPAGLAGLVSGPASVFITIWWVLLVLSGSCGLCFVSAVFLCCFLLPFSTSFRN